MAEKGFGVKEVNLIGASGTPTITSPNNLNLNANNVAISTNVSIGGTLSVTGNVSVGGTLTYEDVTSIDSVGIITARSEVIVGRGLTVTGISTFSGDVHFSLHNSGNPKIEFDESSNLLWFKSPTIGGTSSKLWLGNGTSYNNLELVTDYTGGGLAQMNVANANLIIRTNNTGKNIELQSQNDLTLANGTYPFIKGEKNSGSDQSVTLYYGQTGSTPYANPKLVTTSTGVTITGTAVATTFSGSGASLTELPAGSLTGTVADARISTLTASKLSGALPAISGANLTNIPAPVEAPVVNFTVTANGSSAYRFSGGGVDDTADDPDLYLIRGQTYRFNNTTGSAHPFQFRATTGGSAYTAGVSGDQNGVQFFTPDNDAPSKIYYICTLHSGMVGTIYIRGANGANENVGVTTFANKITVESSTNTVANFKGSGGAGFIQITDADDGSLAFIGVDGGAIKLQTSGSSYSDKLIIDSNGKVNIASAVYGGGGTSPELYVKGTSGRQVKIHNSNAGTCGFQLTNSSTGEGEDAGIQLAVLGGGGGYFKHHLSNANVLDMYSQVSGSQKYIMKIYNDGKIGQQSNSDCLMLSTSQDGSGNNYFLRGSKNSTQPGGGNDVVWIYEDGDIYNNNNTYGQQSDIKLKENIVDASSQWNDIKNLKVRNFNFKSSTGFDTHTQIGLVAQEAELVSPGLIKVVKDRVKTEEKNELDSISYNESFSETETTKYVKYSVLHMKAIKCLQEAQARIETLEAEVAALKAK